MSDIRRGMECLLWAGALAVLGAVAVTPASAQGRMRLNGRILRGDPALNVRGRTYLPARTLFSQIGEDVEWCDGDCRFRRDGHRYRFRPRTRVYYYDEFPRYFPGESFVRGGRLYVPGSVIRDFGGRYRWNDGYLDIDFPR